MRKNFWSYNVHQVVCPDGAVVAYAWERQLAGQAAGASAINRTSIINFIYD
ncbi:hypothetical protein Ddye_008451 [Dipteronia dyeriana]|uniref:Uncharacterized protein n=1 Tax=Dipteronia dyeriana TaxID=168575 RepID=A0AAD9X9J5_9ROSI|nr:hypothetical protein Ddye_008451 [Dipteronia dyeriana]